MNIMILAAGLGTRLLPHTKRLPKPLFPVLDKTLLQIAIETAKKAEPDVIVVNAYHLASQIEGFLRLNDFGVEIVVSRETELLGTAGGIKAAEKWLKSDDFGVINSDIIADVDWTALETFHKTNNSELTLMLRPNPDPAVYSPVCVNSAGKIARLASTQNTLYKEEQEKLLFTGVSIVSPRLLSRIPSGEPFDISKEIYLPMVANEEAFYGYATASAWTDAGTAENYHKAVMKALDSYFAIETEASVTVNYPVYGDPTARVEPEAVIGPYVALGEEAVIGEGATVQNCVVLPGSIVAPGADIDGGIV